jgi:Asp-tRNA(Asn)/Glu-tRNA(Gln) amidotransferase A subunit family amidase
LAVKESIDLPGALTILGNPAWQNNIAANDHDVIKRIHNAGAILFGKTNVTLKLTGWQPFSEI